MAIYQMCTRNVKKFCIRCCIVSMTIFDMLYFVCWQWPYTKCVKKYQETLDQMVMNASVLY